MKRSIVAAFCLAVTLHVGGALAQPPRPLDILGIQLGMPANQAVQILNAHVAKLRAQNIEATVQPTIITFDTFPNPVTWGMNAAARGNDSAPDESIFVVFTLPPNPAVVVEVHRDLQYNKNEPAKDALFASLRGKYGPESIKSGDVTDMTHRWLFKDGQQQFFANQYGSDYLNVLVCGSEVSGSGAGYGAAFDFTYELNNALNRGFSEDVKSKCGSHVFVTTTFDTANQGLVHDFQSSIADLAMETTAIEKTRALLQNRAEAKRQKAIENAKQNSKPQL